MATSDYSNEDVGLVLSAASPTALFGDNPKRARIRYHRLVRSVHPDANGGSKESVDAMKKLNALWSEYVAGSDGDGRNRRTLREVARNDSYAVFEDGDHWLVVERRVSGSVSISGEDLSDVLDGSPVCVLSNVRSKLISQGDGTHAAYSCDVPSTISDGVIMLTSLDGRLHGGVMHPADMAWVTKRILYLCAAMGRKSLRFSGHVDPAQCVAISPENHMLALMTPWELDTSDGSTQWQRVLVGSCLPHLRDMADGERCRRILRFLEGTMLDTYTESIDLVREFDELMYELFGPPKFHVMEVKDA